MGGGNVFLVRHITSYHFEFTHGDRLLSPTLALTPFSQGIFESLFSRFKNLPQDLSLPQGSTAADPLLCPPGLLPKACQGLKSFPVARSLEQLWATAKPIDNSPCLRQGGKIWKSWGSEEREEHLTLGSEASHQLRSCKSYCWG